MAQLTKNFGKIVKTLTIPHLLNLQIDSYELFLQKDVPPPAGRTRGLKASSVRSFPSRTSIEPPRWSMSAMRSASQNTTFPSASARA